MVVTAQPKAFLVKRSRQRTPSLKPGRALRNRGWLFKMYLVGCFPLDSELGSWKDFFLTSPRRLGVPRSFAEVRVLTQIVSCSPRWVPRDRWPPLAPREGKNMERTGVNLVLSSLRWAGDSLNRKEAVAQLWSRNWMGEGRFRLAPGDAKEFPQRERGRTVGGTKNKILRSGRFPASRGPLKPWLLVQAGTMRVFPDFYRE